jgi:hypothetical protein
MNNLSDDHMKNANSNKKQLENRQWLAAQQPLYLSKPSFQASITV